MQYVILVLAIIAMIIVGRILVWPVKKIFKLVLNIVIGLIMILFINVFGARFGIQINFNSITALISGFLGIPGVITLIILQFVF